MINYKYDFDNHNDYYNVISFIIIIDFIMF